MSLLRCLRQSSMVYRLGLFGVAIIVSLSVTALVASDDSKGASNKKSAPSKGGKRNGSDDGDGSNATRPTRQVPRAVSSPAPTGVPKLQPGEIDLLLERELANAKVPLSPLTNDHDFVRRVCLDVTGKLPTPQQLDEFASDTDPQKRSKLIDKLLTSDDYAGNWARYWRDVIGYHAIDPRARIAAKGFEDWLSDQLKRNVHWDQIAEELITATGSVNEDGRTYLIFAQFDMENTPVNLASELTRVFMGIQVACAQCHDHPYDQWKREQFHETAAFFARTIVRRENGGDPRSFVVTSLEDAFGDRPFAKAVAKKGMPRGREHQMPDANDPEKKTTMHPKFLLGQETPHGISDKERREYFVDFLTDRNNYWFARAYVNRIWGELMGEGFYEPVDDLGPERNPRFPMILNRIAAEWRTSDYDVRWLFRTILNTRAYQRQIRPRDPSVESPPFAAMCATRLRDEQIFDSLTYALGLNESQLNRMVGRTGPPGKVAGGMARAGVSPARAAYIQNFGVDPSLSKGDVLGTIASALLIMNGAFNQALNARGDTLLGRMLPVFDDDDEVIRLLYKRTLARAPSDRELATAKAYIKEVGDRHEAFEDLLWCLVNSTEMITKR